MHPTPEKSQCAALTKAGGRCKRLGSPYCAQHSVIDANSKAGTVPRRKGALSPTQADHPPELARKLQPEIPKPIRKGAQFPVVNQAMLDIAKSVQFPFINQAMVDIAKNVQFPFINQAMLDLVKSVPFPVINQAILDLAKKSVQFPLMNETMLALAQSPKLPEFDEVWRATFPDIDYSVGMAVIDSTLAETDGAIGASATAAELAAGAAVLASPEYVEEIGPQDQRRAALMGTFVLVLAAWMVSAADPAIQTLTNPLGFLVMVAQVAWGALAPRLGGGSTQTPDDPDDESTGK